jgi:hypothetical protein
MQPTLHISISGPYRSEPSSSSGGLAHRETVKLEHGEAPQALVHKSRCLRACQRPIMQLNCPHSDKCMQGLYRTVTPSKGLR